MYDFVVKAKANGLKLVSEKKLQELIVCAIHFHINMYRVTEEFYNRS